ncbi:hypothetical protein Tco_1162323, partial [Tanacetum coccineum]
YMAIATLIDANYLVYALGAEPKGDRVTSPSPSPSSSRKYTRNILERGFILAIFGIGCFASRLRCSFGWLAGWFRIYICGLSLGTLRA